MKPSSVIVAACSLAFSWSVLAAPPSGAGGGRDTSGAMPTQSAPASTAGATHSQAQTRSTGQSSSDQLTNNSKLASRIHDMTGSDAQQACSGFASLGDCVAAVHVSQNLGIGFDSLKAKVTGEGATDLGQAIQQLKPEADAKSEVGKAHKQAKEDLKAAGQ